MPVICIDKSFEQATAVPSVNYLIHTGLLRNFFKKSLSCNAADFGLTESCSYQSIEASVLYTCCVQRLKHLSVTIEKHIPRTP